MGAAVATAASYGRILGANERIRIGGIGTGSRGEYLLGNVKNLEMGEIVAVCDVYEPHRARVKSRLAAEAREYVDHREVLDRKDIDAVVIATPDHWHVPITIDAVRAGKDVYCEKPVTHLLAEGEPLIAAVHESKRVVQTGTQQRSWEHYMHAQGTDRGRANWGRSRSSGRTGIRTTSRTRPRDRRSTSESWTGNGFSVRHRRGRSTPTSMRTGAGIGISAAAR